MNASLVDINKDGRLDLYVTVIDMFSKGLNYVLPNDNTIKNLDDRILKSAFYLSGNKLFLNTKSNGFLPVESKYFGPVNKGWSWGAKFFDYDNDGNDDAYITNGYIPGWWHGDQQNQFYLNIKNKFYHIKNHVSDESFKGNSRSVSAIDFANKGKLDLLVSNYLKHPSLLVNKSNNHNNWIKVKLRGIKNNYFGIGSNVKININGKKSLVKAITCGSGYLSQNGNTLFFGLNKTKAIDSIEVIWPGGDKQMVQGPIKSNRTIIINES